MFKSHVASDVLQDGQVLIPAGAEIDGRVVEVSEGHAGGHGSIRLRPDMVILPDGRRFHMVGIALEFDAGRVVSARADEGEDYLLSMLDLDPGARRLGELGLGLNAGIDRFTGSILYDEKIGGTVHLALGQSYPETGGVNESALHWDLIVDTRAGGRITADGRVVMEDGRLAGRLIDDPSADRGRR